MLIRSCGRVRRKYGIAGQVAIGKGESLQAVAVANTDEVHTVVVVVQSPVRYVGAV